MANLLRFLLLVLSVCFGRIAAAQPSLHKMQQKLLSEKNNGGNSVYAIELNPKLSSQGSVFFSGSAVLQKNNLLAWLKDKLELRQGVDSFKILRQPAAYFGSDISKLQQYYKGIKVEHGVIAEADIQQAVRLLQLEFYSIPDTINLSPAITEAAALTMAKTYVGAAKYQWEQPGAAMPRAELVIVEDIKNRPGSMNLAYKFDIYALAPESRSIIYVDAVNGRVVFTDHIIKNCHRTAGAKGAGTQPGKVYDLSGVKVLRQNTSPVSFRNFPLQDVLSAMDTRYSGSRTTYTTADGFGAYQLAASAIGSNTYMEVRTNHNQQDISLSSSVTDNDNVWTSAEFPNNINMALDAYWGMQRSIEYWWQVHGRKSFDNNNGAVYSYVFYRSDPGELYDNASWNGGYFRFGEGGFPPDNHMPWTCIDIVGHEFGHAVCDYTAGLVYERESGALNEGFSDIWGACTENFIAAEIAPATKQLWQIGEDISYSSQTMLRSMENPPLKQDPDTYLDVARNWKDATYTGCAIPDRDDNDNCGVHSNSGVLNKWFKLISSGGSGLNGNFVSYSVTALGIAKSQRIAYFTEQMLTPNSGFEAARVASVYAVQLLAASANGLGITVADTSNVKEAWRAVGVLHDTLFNKKNTPVFLSDTFTTVGIGKYGTIWAGTMNKGMYRFNGTKWEIAPSLNNHFISDIKADIDGRLWVAQYGRSGAQALGGGVSCYVDSSFASYKYYATDSGLSARNARSLYINNTLVFDTFKRVWAAVFSDNTNAGSLVRGSTNYSILDFNYKPFKKIGAGINPSFGYCQTVGGNDNEIWVFASTNGPGSINQILRYKTSDSSFLGFYDQTNTILPASFNAKAIYADTLGKRWWVGLTTGGLYVYDVVTATWQNINPSSVFPSGTVISNFAITGDADGNIFIGTNKGYVKFTGRSNGSILDPSNTTYYTRYTVADGLPSDTVRAICVDNRASRLILATDQGIAFRYNLCKECVNASPFYTIAPGNWSDPSVWFDGKVPGPNAIVIIRDPVVVNQHTTVKLLTIKNTGSITVSPGIQFNILGVNRETY